MKTISSGSAASTKPLPVPSTLSTPFWEALRRHEFVLQRCCKCGAYNHPPKITCPHCHSLELEWTPVATTGTVYSYTIVHRAPTPAFRDDIPYAVGLVDIDGVGVRLLSSLVMSPGEVRVGMRVKLIFDDVASDFTLFRFAKTGNG
jgi:uncharacterized OB-fold protein